MMVSRVHFFFDFSLFKQSKIITMKKLIFTALFSIFSILNLSAQTTDASMSKLYQNYISIKESLVTDNSDGASKAANEFIKSVSMVDYKVLSEGNLDVLRKDASTIAESRSIESQRESFAKLSANMIAVAKNFKLADSSVFILYCPMQDASWLSAQKEIKNPFYGSAMLTCGSMKSELK